MHVNKAQMELMGLAIIIVLVALGMLFALYFMLSSPPSKATEKIRETIMAANFLNTMIRTTTDCFDRDVKELLQDCARGGTITCPASSDRPAEGTCERSDLLIDKLLSEYFTSIGRSYSFAARGATGLDDIKHSCIFQSGAKQCQKKSGAGAQQCPGEKVAKTDPIPVGGFEIEVTVNICF